MEKLITPETVLGSNNQSSSLYMIVEGNKYHWMVPLDCDSSKVFKVDLFDQTGSQGKLVNFNVEMRKGLKSVKVFGPHLTNFKEVEEDTGVDFTDPEVRFVMMDNAEAEQAQAV